MISARKRFLNPHTLLLLFALLYERYVVAQYYNTCANIPLSISVVVRRRSTPVEV